MSRSLRTGFFAVSACLVFFLLLWGYVVVLAAAYPALQDRALLGDSFGALGALASSVVLILVATSVMLQRKDLALQLEEMSQSAKAQRKQAAAMTSQLEHLQEAAKEERELARRRSQPVLDFSGLESAFERGEVRLVVHKAQAFNLRVSLHQVLSMTPVANASGHHLSPALWTHFAALVAAGSVSSWPLGGVDERTMELRPLGIGVLLCEYEDEHRESHVQAFWVEPSFGGLAIAAHVWSFTDGLVLASSQAMLLNKDSGLFFGRGLYEGPGQDLLAALVDQLFPGVRVKMPGRYRAEALPEARYLRFQVEGSMPEVQHT